MKNNYLFDSIISVQVAKLLIRIGAVTFSFHPVFTYTSGIKSPIYLDNRLVMSYPLVRKKITDYYLEIIKKKIGIKNINWISATATAAIPQAAFVAMKLNLPMVYVRPTTKTYGKGGKVEGYLKKGSKVVIIEDHISTAESVAGNAQAIRELGAKVEYCVATTTYETEKSKQLLSGSNISLYCLTTGKIIVETANQMKKLSPKEKLSIDRWFADPLNWAKKEGIE